MACLHEVRDNRYDAEYWFTVNMVTSILSTLLFIFLGILLQRLRRSNRLRAKMERFLPTSKNKQSKPWYKKNKKKKETSTNFPTNLPYPQVDSYQQYCKMMEKNGMNGILPFLPICTVSINKLSNAKKHTDDHQQ